MNSLRFRAVHCLVAFAPLSDLAVAESEKPMMKAIVVHEYGGPEVLKYEDAPRPEPKENEVLVRVIACGVNPADPLVVSGRLAKEFGTHLPLIPGYDVAGVVEKAGAKVTKFKVGDGVYGYALFGGGWAEYAVLAENEAALKPKSLTYVEAAGVPLAALTAWQALIDTAKLSTGQTALIHGGSGGVGSFAIQIAKSRGARVIATASTANQDLLKQLGADVAVDYTKTKFEEAVKEVDVVLDPVGRDTLARSYAVVKKGGIIVTIVARPDQAELDKYGIRGASVWSKPDGNELAEITKLIEEKKIKPILTQVIRGEGESTGRDASHAREDRAEDRGRAKERLDERARLLHQLPDRKPSLPGRGCSRYLCRPMDEDAQSSNRSARLPSSLKASAQEGLKDAVKEVVKDKAVQIIGAALSVIAVGSIPILQGKACLPGWVLIVIGTIGALVGTTLHAYFARKRVSGLCVKFEEQKAGLQGEIENLKKQIEEMRPDAELLKDMNDLHECIRSHLKEVLKLSVDRPRDSKPTRALSVSAIAIDGFSEIARSHPYGVTRLLLDLLVSLVLDERRGSSDSVYRLNELVYIVSRFEPAEKAGLLPDRVRARAGGVSPTVAEGEQLPKWSMSAGVAEIDVPREAGNDVDQRIRNALESATVALKEAGCTTDTVRIAKRSP